MQKNNSNRRALDSISILVTCYNKSKFIENASKYLVEAVSLGAQVVIVDDGSSDNSFDLLKKYFLHFSNQNTKDILITKIPNVGSAGARNFALDRAVKQYCIFVDIDDKLDINSLSLLLNEFKQSNTDFCMSNYSNNSNSSLVDNLLVNESKAIKDVSEIRDLFFEKLGYWRIIYSTKILRRNHLRFMPTFKDLNDSYFILDDVFWLLQVYSLKNSSWYVSQSTSYYTYTLNDSGVDSWKLFISQVLKFPKAAYLVMKNDFSKDLDFIWIKKNIHNQVKNHSRYLPASKIIQYFFSCIKYFRFSFAFEVLLNSSNFRIKRKFRSLLKTH